MTLPPGEQSDEITLHGKRAMIAAIVVAEMMVVGPMIALLPHWMAFWEPRFIGLMLMTMAAPFVMILPSAWRVKVAEAVADNERRRSAAIADITGHPELVPDRTEPKP